MVNKNVEKYLQKYAEPEVFTVSDEFTDQSFTYALVIPAYKESSEFIERFCQSEISQQNVLLINVINQPVSCQNSRDQQVLSQRIKRKGEIIFEQDNLCLVSLFECNSAILIVDRFTQGIEENKGVGLARKVGADLALMLIRKGVVSNHWIFSSDADAHLPSEYFNSVTRLDKKYVAATYNFNHFSEDPIIHHANWCYELALRYYLAGLTYAGSHYDFFTIGSALVFDHQAYAMARGFPTRSAGEDFYLLNKVAKLGDVAFIEHVHIKIDARTSDRVPFGTGPTVQKIIEHNKNKQSYCYYHPELFVQLKTLIDAFSNLYPMQLKLTTWYGTLPDVIVCALKQIGFEKFFNTQQKTNQLQFNKQLTVWFDAFKTLRFLHQLRAIKYPDIPLEQALKDAPFDVVMPSGK